MQQIQQTTQDMGSYNRNAQAIIDQVKAVNQEYIDNILEYALQVFDSNQQPLRKFLILRLIKDCIVNKSAKFINKYVSSRALLNRIGTLCMHRAGEGNPERGQDMFNGEDPQSSAQVLKLALELVQYLANTYPLDAKKNPTKFKIQFDELQQSGVHFPTKPELIKLFDPHEKVNGNSHVQQNHQQNTNFKERDETMLELNQMKSLIHQDIQMINETLLEGQADMEYVNDILETYSQSLQIQEKKFEKTISKALEFDGVMNEDEVNEILLLKQFTQEFPKYYQSYFKTGCTYEAFIVIRDKTLAFIAKILAKDYETPQPQQEKKQQLPKHSQYMNDEYDQFTTQQLKQEQHKQEQLRLAELEHRKQEQHRQEQEHKRQEEAKREQQRQYQLEQQRQEQQRLDAIKREQDLQEQQRILSQKQQQQQQQQQFKQTTKQSNYLQSPYETQTPYEQNQFNNQQFLTPQSGFVEQGLTKNQVDRLSQGFHKFEEDFDGLSQSTITQSRFPMRHNEQIPIKNHTGQLIQFQSEQFDILDRLGLSDSQKKRFKVAGVYGKAALVNSRDLQIGVKSTLQFVPLNQKNYLKVIVYIGNKSRQSFEQCRLSYEGDNQNFMMWTKPDRIQTTIEPGEQIKQEIICIYKTQHFRLVDLVFQCNTQGNHVTSMCFLPTTLLQFMEFKNINAAIFRNKWRAKKNEILKSETFLLNPKIIKAATYIKKVFPLLCDLNSIQQFQDQLIDQHLQHHKYISYKLGGLFNLTNVSHNFMMKLIIHPNMMCTIQLIPLLLDRESGKSTGCQLLHTITWMLGIP